MCTRVSISSSQGGTALSGFENPCRRETGQVSAVQWESLNAL